MAREHIAARELAQHQPTPLELVVLAQPLDRCDDLVQLSTGGVGKRLGADGLRAEEQQRLDRSFELSAGGGEGLVGHPVADSLAAGEDALAPADAGADGIACTVISPNGSPWIQVAS